ncbi:unnamed protein product [Cuscuta epithymum]|uniref:PQ-loop repeat family protein / transmembrane family protein n=1 Tax=Cuscuta epithymum TaxID=186058 RepID=A0AAV0GH06_9ASTE|nr:unnamed protein product [Cuscuta epithymum]
MGGSLEQVSNYYYCEMESRGCSVWWVEKYFKDCLCNLSDEISFALGLISLVCWGLAEIPQLITNFTNKSASGLSLSFLFTWIVGDIFNLFGCILDPATLPTQFFTALLYTITTIALVVQCIYYEHFLRWLKRRDNKKSANLQVTVDGKEEVVKKPKLRHHQSIGGAGPNAPIIPSEKHYYFMSLRTLASSATPPRGSYINVVPRSGPPALQHYNSDSSEDETAPLSSASNKTPITRPRSIPRPTAYGTFLAAAAAAYYPAGGDAALLVMGHATRTTRFVGRRLLLQEHNEIDNNVLVGQWLGWLMAAIYMGGRIPQIWLNIKRGSIEGLNPLMFIFVLVANATYFGSIMVRSTEWEKISANMPWLVDAVACVLLDLFIILQYLYYSRLKTKKIETSYI